MGELGYPTSVEEMEERFERISAYPDYHTLVAEADGSVVGMIGLCSGVFYEKNGGYARIVAFVVDERFRNKGIGKLLIQEAERWARDNGLVAIALNSGNRSEREAAHLFYRRAGYTEKSTGFIKQL
ncbi:GNAT family N-acetyltransferase [Paenibacillus sp. MMS18-CY102]|nr:GNAT family N-acetyltransferase [Paenibacillus sp. MMS18-CY102]MWC27143.1 GNAT family N-acetyltransferase [Paenibacillus sp. MMS18-CY102]